jgi:Cu(I)/Ag(I) efflux system periplasmic protein CusF
MDQWKSSTRTREVIMNIIQQILAISAVALGAALPMSSFAQATMEPAKTEAAQSTSLTDGEIKKVDLDNGKVTIKHGDIQHLDMPGMTMVFTAKDKNLLSNLKLGDKVKFMVVQEGGKMIVTDIQPAR